MCKKSSFPVVFNVFLAFLITLVVTIFNLAVNKNLTGESLLIGMIQSVSAVYISNAYSGSIAFGLLVVTLIFFPRGLVPERLEENV